MWYKIWTTILEQVPYVVVGTILLLIACIFVVGQEKPVTEEIITVTVDGKEFNFKIK